MQLEESSQGSVELQVWEHGANQLGGGYDRQQSPQEPHGNGFFHPLECEPSLHIGYAYYYALNSRIIFQSKICKRISKKHQLMLQNTKERSWFLCENAFNISFVFHVYSRYHHDQMPGTSVATFMPPGWLPWKLEHFTSLRRSVWMKKQIQN